MAKYDESEYFTDSQEEIAEREAQEAMRRLVRTEIRRVQSGDADEDIAEDIAREEAVEKKKKKRHKPAWMVKLQGLFTGEILLTEEASQIYNFLVLLGIIFIGSIFAIFATFQQEMKCNKLKVEIALLKEKAIRTSEIRAQQTTHSAILEKLNERGIELEDPSSTPTILK